MTVYHKEFNPPLVNPSKTGIALRCFFGNRRLKEGVHNLSTEKMNVSLTVKKGQDKQVRGTVSLSSKEGRGVILVQDDVSDDAPVSSIHKYTAQYRIDETSEELVLSDDIGGNTYVKGVLWFKPN